MATRVTIWNEYRHEKKNPKVGEIYPDGMHNAIASGIRAEGGFEVRTATLDEPSHGLTDDVLASTDVMIWWGHLAHGEVSDEIVQKVYERVLDGMGLIALHSAHYSKIFKKLMGTGCDLKWREATDSERIWIVDPGHPIADGLPERLEIGLEEMYGEHFNIPQPDQLVMVSWFTGGEVFRSGCCYHRGRGRVFYFRPGHETYPTFHNPEVIRVISNAVKWATPGTGARPAYALNGPAQPLEKLP